MWINLERLKEWKNSLQNGLLWRSEKNGWRWRVYNRFKDGKRNCITFRLLSPEGKAYEQTTYSVGDRKLYDNDESIAWALIEVLTMNEDERG